MSTKLNSQQTTHPKLQLVGLLMATALLATACGGGGGGDSSAAPPAGGPPAAASDVATLADIEACPAVGSYIKDTTWYTKCLVGKRLVGKDAITGEACELRLKAGGVFEYAKNGVVLSTTKPVSEWKLDGGLASVDGFYTNSLISSPVGSNRILKASLFGGYNPTPSTYLGYSFDITVLVNTLSPSDLGSNEDIVTFDVPGGKTENCKLNNI
jgi:hypothetical protein